MTAKPLAQSCEGGPGVADDPLEKLVFFVEGEHDVPPIRVYSEKDGELRKVIGRYHSYCKAYFILTQSSHRQPPASRFEGHT